MTTKKRLQDAMQAHDDRSRGEERHFPIACIDHWERCCCTCGRHDMSGPVARAHAEITRSGFTDRREDDETGAGVSRDTPEAHGGAESVVEQAARVVDGTEWWLGSTSASASLGEQVAQALADANLLADPARLREQGWVGPDEARRLREDVQHWQEKAQEAGEAYGLANHLAAALEAENARVTEQVEHLPLAMFEAALAGKSELAAARREALLEAAVRFEALACPVSGYDINGATQAQRTAETLRRMAEEGM
jgi:hypothetical protein